MILDGLIVRLASGGKSLPSDTITDARNLIHSLKTKSVPQQLGTYERSHCRIKYFHPKIALNLELAILSEDLCSQRLSVTTLLEKVAPIELLCAEFQYLLRGLLLTEDDNLFGAYEWNQIWKCLLKMAKYHGDASTDLMYFLLYSLAQEVEAKRQLELLKAMTSFATVKVRLRIKLYQKSIEDQ